MVNYYELVAYPSLFRGGELTIEKLGSAVAHNVTRNELLQLFHIGDKFVVKARPTNKFSVMRRSDRSLETVASFDDKDTAIMALRLLI